MQKVMIVGGGVGGTTVLKLLSESEVFSIVCMADTNESAEGMLAAKERKIPTVTNWSMGLERDLDIIFDTTGDPSVYKKIKRDMGEQTILIPGSVALIMAKLFEEKNRLISKLENTSAKMDLILNTTSEGMVVIDHEGFIIMFNDSAERASDTKREDVIGRHIKDFIPSTGLLRVMQTNQKEVNQEITLSNGMELITTRIPLVNADKEIIGAFSVFRNKTEAVQLAEQITDLKEIQTMLQAIIQSSDEAISVVDDQGRGLLINPAYTRITGLTKTQVIGKPASIDIYEGESMHMKVLQTKKPVRGVNMRVGPKHKEVIVNVAPIIVDGCLKGSVGVIHDVSEIQALTHELNRARQIIRTLQAKYSFDDIIGASEEMKLPIEQAKLSAKTPATVLLRGESGTGKELFAHAIHNASDRKFNKFVRVNCAAISESLLESELFGYDEGAFTGASRGGKVGFFEEANQGSIFLDEIGELPANIQAKLLRVLQEKEIIRVGGTKPIPINVRVIAATNINLEQAIATGSFREDLYFRLNRMPIFIAPLRKRREDLRELAEHLINKINQEYGRSIEGITAAAIHKMQIYNWPGNVRELENILGRAIIFMKLNETIIDIHHIPDFIEEVPLKQEKLVMKPSGYVSGKPLSEIIDQCEAEIIQQAFHTHKGNKTLTAKALGISVRNLYYKMEKLKL
ncbi:sigma-54-dependent Fis family transcriptional regulator [Peribacillus simplex]|uniref:sigma-54 interaction domain-containing protein n=1 Tax=Peribacillus simplex TaxID=1478 RepID=UPI001D779F98|nr:sigma-54-dependent Fis family transcriptional regulator [Peribacillus simplex]MED3985431.1 sigma-54-dependent Fis family transcriptional regulator [Peribacillus simplex]MED4093820.1 sigma-54-dependent Fis family transcriptional regulator [Peribacillus simplex]CAH0219032.1 Arginine utilization regulatory protein RocR [Peribacillus simplex]